MEVLGALMVLILLGLALSLRVSFAVLYGLRRVFAFSVKTMEALVFRRSQLASSWFGESGSAGGGSIRIGLAVFGVLTVGGGVGASVRIWFGSCSGVFMVNSFLTRSNSSCVWLVRFGDLGRWFLGSSGSWSSLFSEVRISKWSISMFDSLEVSCLVFLRYGDGPVVLPWLMRSKFMILSSLSSIWLDVLSILSSRYSIRSGLFRRMLDSNVVIWAWNVSVKYSISLRCASCCVVSIFM